MKKFAYIVLFFLTIIVHYLGTPILVYWITVDIFKLPQSWVIVNMLVIWLGAGLLFKGCPYTYVEQLFAHKAWGAKRTYNFTKSLLYKLIFKRLYQT